jgi:hypothetical protein
VRGNIHEEVGSLGPGVTKSISTDPAILIICSPAK